MKFMQKPLRRIIFVTKLAYITNKIAHMIRHTKHAFIRPQQVWADKKEQLKIYLSGFR